MSNILAIPAEPPMTTTSFQEKSVWIQLIAMTLALGAYFILAGRMLAAGVHALPAYVGLFAVAVVAMVIIMVAGHIAAAIASRKEGTAPDERDRLITWRAESNSAWILAAGIIAAISAMLFEVPTAWVANGLLAALYLSEVVGFILRIVYYRRGISAA